MTAPLLAFHNVSFRYGAREILQNASLALRPGSATALIGANGVGKTTLLHLARGLKLPSSGTVEFDGRSLKDLSMRQVARRIALVPQQIEVPFEYTVLEVVAQGRTPYLSFLGGLAPDDRRALDKALDLTNTSMLRHRIFNELSGGERQRVKIALGLAQQPQLLLLDEPTQNLDVGRQVELLDLLRHLRESGLTILASLHDLHLIAGNFETVILLRASDTPLIGPPVRILEKRLIQDAFDCAAGAHPFFEQLTRIEHRAEADKESQ